MSNPVIISKPMMKRFELCVKKIRILYGIMINNKWLDK